DIVNLSRAPDTVVGVGMSIAEHPGGQVVKIRFKRQVVVWPCLTVDAGGGVSLQREVRRAQALDVVHVVQQRGEPLFPLPFRCHTHPLDAIRRSHPALCRAVVTAPTHGSGSLWVGRPSTCRTFIYCTAPV